MEKVVVQFVQRYNVNAFVQNCKHMPSNTFEVTVAMFHKFSAMFSNPIDSFCSVDSSIFESFANPVDLQLLVK